MLCLLKMKKKKKEKYLKKQDERFFSSLHISFMRSQGAPEALGPVRYQLPGCLQSWHRSRNGNEHHQHISKEYSFCTAPCQRNGLFLQEPPRLGEGVCGKTSIIPRTPVSAVLPDRGKRADASHRKCLRNVCAPHIHPLLVPM